jgi:hypothetical protein
MAGDDFETLMNARAALAKNRLTWAKAIATPGEIPEGAIKAIIEVQHAIDAVDRAIEELEVEEDEEEDDDE